jgi:hypothetical protein
MECEMCADSFFVDLSTHSGRSGLRVFAVTTLLRRVCALQDIEAHGNWDGCGRKSEIRNPKSEIVVALTCLERRVTDSWCLFHGRSNQTAASTSK